MRRRKAGAGSMATTSCPSSFKASGSPTGSKLPPTRRPRNPKPPPPEPSGHHQNSAIAHGIALALSGGGYRAMLFHTGALIRLNELGLLSQLKRVPGLSGGSISAGFLGLVWKSLSWQDSISTNFNGVYVIPILAFSRKSIGYVAGTVGFLTQGR